MNATIERPPIKTDNELYGNGYLDEGAPGIWLVLRDDVICHLFSNRLAAEAYIYDRAEEHEVPPDTYRIQVWAVSETWPEEE